MHTWVPSHASAVLRRLETNLFPDIGAIPIGELTAPGLLAALRKVEHRGAHDPAHRILQVAGQVFRYGIATGRCERDLSVDLCGAFTPHKGRHQAAIKPEELPGLLRAIDGYAQLGDRLTSLALRLLALTFVRTGELIGADWEEFDFESMVWIIPAGRMEMKTEHVVPLARQAAEILRALRAIGDGSRCVFPGRNPDRPISNNTMLFALYRLGYKGKMTGRGLRRVASTILNEAGFRGDVIERQLADGERDEIRGAYNRAEYLPERRAMMQQWADMLDALTQGGGRESSRCSGAHDQRRGTVSRDESPLSQIESIMRVTAQGSEQPLASAHRLTASGREYASGDGATEWALACQPEFRAAGYR